MTLGLIGKKIGMTQLFDDAGLPIPVTVIALGENIVVQNLTEEKNGYRAIQVGGFLTKEAQLNKPEVGVLKKHALPLLKPLVEFKTSTESYNVGDKVRIEEVVKEGMLVDIRGRSIGKGFQGRIKRHHGKRGAMSHGSKNHRLQGSIGQHSDPGRVFPGLKMAGHMGDENVCMRHLQVVRINLEKRTLIVRGSVPGVEGGVLTIIPSKTKWN